MPPASYERLTALRDRIEAASNAEVIRRALQLYEAVVEEAQKGNEVAIRKKDGDEVRYMPIF